jgi:HCOMODA/2-hydroxy-3-carboxy-muconic semialdehyde decarboxylase
VDALVVVNRILASEQYGVLDTSGHASVRSTSNPNHFFLARWIAPGIVTAKDVIEYDLDAKPVAGNRPDQYLERYIHSEIYKARPDVNAVVHAHTPELVAFGVSSVPLAAYDRLRGGWVKRGLPIYDIRKYNGGRPGIVETQPLGQALAQVLGRNSAVLLQGHGLVAVSSSIYGLPGSAIGLRTDAQMQQEAIHLGQKINYLDPEPAAQAPPLRPQPQYVPSDGGTGAGPDRAWNVWKREIEQQLDAEAKGPTPPSGEVAKTRAQWFEDLARANRILYKMGFLDSAGHVSMRNPENPNRYFLSRYIASGSVTPADIVEYDLDSVPVGSNRNDGYQERFLHGEMYKARPDVMAVVHSHTQELIVFGATAETAPLRPIANGGTFIGDGLPLYDIRKYRTENETIISTPALGRSLGQVIGKAGAAFLLGHGMVTVDSSLYGLVGRAESLRENARVQIQAVGLGGNVSYLNPVPPPAPQPANAPPRVTGEGGGRGWQYWVRQVSIR